MGDVRTDETENLTADDRTLGELLHGLKRVDAPANFESQVKARIGDGEPKTSAGWRGFPVPVYVASLAAVLLFGSLFVLREFYWVGDQGVPAVAGTKKSQPAPKGPGTVNSQQQQPAVNDVGLPSTGPNGQEVAGPPANFPMFNRRNPNPDRLAPGGSIDQGQGNAAQPMPRGFDQNPARLQTANPGSNAHIPITDFLNAIGIAAGFQRQTLKVSSVRSGSIADKSGVQAGDIIGAIGDKKITGPNTSFGGRIEAKTLTIIRGGQTIQINISTR